MISVENLSKKYDINFKKDTHKTFRDSISDIFNPSVKTIGSFANRKKEEFFALENINFNVSEGETVGIIGSNGAGKSTLLKILSRITYPTSGKVRIRGRVASLLEVGTGFHPELTGRENIYLNGVILGMSKKEINKRFDDIVEFAGIQKFLDTPVKKYSSGMYVRLAFSVAAHMDTDVLLIDEVLAVGDLAFQQKCLDKIDNITKDSKKTVLFISHNMTAVNSICSKCLYLKNGKILFFGNTKRAIDTYLGDELRIKTELEWRKNRPGDDVAVLCSARIIDTNKKVVGVVNMHDEFGVEFEYEVRQRGYCPTPVLHVFTSKGELVFLSSQTTNENNKKIGKFRAIAWIPGNLLNEGVYYLGLALTTINPRKRHFFEKNALIFEVVEDISLREGNYSHKIPGIIRPKISWDLIFND